MMLMDPPDSADGMENGSVPVRGTVTNGSVKLSHSLFRRPGACGVSVLLSDGLRSHHANVHPAPVHLPP